MKQNKIILPLNEQPSVYTCIHHAYPCAIIESKELAIISIDSFEKTSWNKLTYDTSIQVEDKRITILEEGGDNTNTILWRSCKRHDEVVLALEYIKPKDKTRYVDVFLFQNDLQEEIAREDKTCGVRWNPYGYFIEKNMYRFETRVYKYIKVCVEDNYFVGYASKNGVDWELVDQKDFPEKYQKGELNIGIHLYLSKDIYADWKAMNFMQLIYNSTSPYKGIGLDYYFFPRKNEDNSYSYFLNFLDTTYDYLYEELDCFETIHDYIHWNIRHDYYLVIAFDEYYLEKREAYHKYHYKHYNLLYGYDDTERVYYLMGYGKTNTPVVSKITYDMVNEKSIVAEKVTRYKYATNLVTLFKFDINSVITGLYELLHNIDSSKKHANLLIEEPVTYGIDNLKILATTEVGRADIRQDKRIAFCIKEHSMMMLERLNYLHKHHYLKDEDYEHLLVGCNQIIHISGILLSMVLMNMVKEENNTSIERRLLELYEIEKVFLTEFLDCLKQEETRSEEM